LLKQAVEKDPDHDQAWLWLTATTQDPAEQKQYLEWAVAANPANAQARRGLAVLTGKLNPKDLFTEAQTQGPRRPADPSAALGAGPQPVEIRRTFTCSRCGGRMQFDPEIADLKCENCGHVEAVDELAVRDGDQVLDFTLPTRQAHRWAEAERRMACQQCGATTIFPPGQTSATCPFCASRALVEAAEDMDLLSPQGLLPMAVSDDQASQAIRGWLGRGFLAPDDLVQLSRAARPKPAYVPCWAFSATLTSRWRAMVSEGFGRDQRWVWRDGEDTLFYTDQLQPGTRALPADLLRQVQPFELTKLVEYKPDYLAGWPAATYDISLSDASIKARGEMVADARKKLVVKALPGRLLREFEITHSDFTGQTYKLMLLPVWVGAYQYHGRTFRVLVNGQTAKVAGDKPVDWAKVAIVVVGAAIMIGLIGATLVLALR
jgi:DNA-directed RNA polymerase subunit RPC12/RpoP